MLLTLISAETAWTNIQAYTQNLNAAYKKELEEIFNNQQVVWVGSLPANGTRTDTLKKVIGADGYWLKMTTTQQRLYFIWYDNASETFLFWGRNKTTVNAGLKAINKRLKKYISLAHHDDDEHHEEEHHDDDDEEPVTPPLPIPGKTYNYFTAKSVTPPTYGERIEIFEYEEGEGEGDEECSDDGYSPQYSPLRYSKTFY
jgi:hypothetical protein